MRVQKTQKITRRTRYGQRLLTGTDRQRKLRQAEGRFANGSTIPEVARNLGTSEATFHRWRKRYGGMSSSEAKRLKELEKENAQQVERLEALALDQEPVELPVQVFDARGP